MGHVVNERKARLSGCVCYKVEREDEEGNIIDFGELMCYSNGVVGTLSDSQEVLFCSSDDLDNPKNDEKDLKQLFGNQAKFYDVVKEAETLYAKMPEDEKDIGTWGSLLKERFAVHYPKDGESKYIEVKPKKPKKGGGKKETKKIETKGKISQDVKRVHKSRKGSGGKEIEDVEYIEDIEEDAVVFDVKDIMGYDKSDLREWIRLLGEEEDTPRFEGKGGRHSEGTVAEMRKFVIDVVGTYPFDYLKSLKKSDLKEVLEEYGFDEDFYGNDIHRLRLLVASLDGVPVPESYAKKHKEAMPEDTIVVEDRGRRSAETKTRPEDSGLAMATRVEPSTRREYEKSISDAKKLLKYKDKEDAILKSNRFVNATLELINILPNDKGLISAMEDMIENTKTDFRVGYTASDKKMMLKKIENKRYEMEMGRPKIEKIREKVVPEKRVKRNRYDNMDMSYYNILNEINEARGDFGRLSELEEYVQKESPEVLQSAKKKKLQKLIRKEKAIIGATPEITEEEKREKNVNEYRDKLNSMVVADLKKQAKFEGVRLQGTKKKDIIDELVNARYNLDYEFDSGERGVLSYDEAEKLILEKAKDDVGELIRVEEKNMKKKQGRELTKREMNMLKASQSNFIDKRREEIYEEYSVEGKVFGESEIEKGVTVVKKRRDKLQKMKEETEELEVEEEAEEEDGIDWFFEDIYNTGMKKKDLIEFAKEREIDIDSKSKKVEIAKGIAEGLGVTVPVEYYSDEELDNALKTYGYKGKAKKREKKVDWLETNTNIYEGTQLGEEYEGEEEAEEEVEEVEIEEEPVDSEEQDDYDDDDVPIITRKTAQKVAKHYAREHATREIGGVGEGLKKKKSEMTIIEKERVNEFVRNHWLEFMELVKEEAIISDKDAVEELVSSDVDFMEKEELTPSEWNKMRNELVKIEVEGFRKGYLMDISEEQGGSVMLTPRQQKELKESVKLYKEVVDDEVEERMSHKYYRVKIEKGKSVIGKFNALQLTLEAEKIKNSEGWGKLLKKLEDDYLDSPEKDEIREKLISMAMSDEIKKGKENPSKMSKEDLVAEGLNWEVEDMGSIGVLKDGEYVLEDKDDGDSTRVFRKMKRGSKEEEDIVDEEEDIEVVEAEVEEEEEDIEVEEEIDEEIEQDEEDWWDSMSVTQRGKMVKKATGRDPVSSIEKVKEGWDSFDDGLKDSLREMWEKQQALDSTNVVETKSEKKEKEEPMEKKPEIKKEEKVTSVKISEVGENWDVTDEEGRMKVINSVFPDWQNNTKERLVGKDWGEIKDNRKKKIEDAVKRKVALSRLKEINKKEVEKVQAKKKEVAVEIDEDGTVEEVKAVAKSPSFTDEDYEKFKEYQSEWIKMDVTEETLGDFAKRFKGDEELSESTKLFLEKAYESRLSSI